MAVYAVTYFHLNTVTYDHIRFIMCIAFKKHFLLHMVFTFCYKKLFLTHGHVFIRLIVIKTLLHMATCVFSLTLLRVISPYCF